MNNYVTGAVIRKIRESKNMTQEEFADKLFVSSKTVSKWETGKGFPDISLIEPLAEALGISVIELMSGEEVKNQNRSFNLRKLNFYVCPVCGNIVQATGDTIVSCCGITLPKLEAEECDANHELSVTAVEDEYFVSINHAMSKEHYVSFIAAVSDFGVQFIKLYPESSAEARFKIDRVKDICFYCNRHGLFRFTIKR